MSILRRLFVSQQINDCDTALRLLTPKFSEELAFSELQKQASEAIRANRDAVQKSMLLDGQTAQTTVLHLISKLSLRECGSGAHHTYRGTLSMRGLSFKRCFLISTSILHEAGVIDAEGLENALENLKNEIAEAG